MKQTLIYIRDIDGIKIYEDNNPIDCDSNILVDTSNTSNKLVSMVEIDRHRTYDAMTPVYLAQAL